MTSYIIFTYLTSGMIYSNNRHFLYYFMQKRVKKTQIPFSVTKRDKKWIIIFFRNLQMWILYWFHVPFSRISPVQWYMQTRVIFLTILYRNLLNNHKIPFLVTKRGQKVDDNIFSESSDVIYVLISCSIFTFLSSRSAMIYAD